MKCIMCWAAFNSPNQTSVAPICEECNKALIDAQARHTLLTWSSQRLTKASE